MRFQLDEIGGVHDLIRDIRWSGHELAAEARRRATIFKRLCCPADNVFVIAHGNTPSFFADLFAVWQVGGCAACVNPALAPDELQNVVGFVNPRAVLVDGVNVKTQAVPVLRAADEPDGPDLPEEAAGAPDDPTLLLFTSGTSGNPKGVVHSRRSIFSRLALNQSHISPAILGRSLSVLPTHFGHGLIGNCLTPLFAGGDLFLMSGAGVTGTSRLGRIVDEHRISFMSSVPAFWRVALRVCRPPVFGTLRQVHIGSAPLSAELWREVIAWAGTDRVANMYGTTETANWIGGAVASELQPENGLLGSPWGGRYAVLGDNGVAAPEGEGEILVQTPSMMSGYHRRPDLTSEVLRDGWYWTGDVGSLDRQGILRIAGRTRYAINRGGIKLYPEELELLLERHPDVAEACAFGVADEVSGETAALAVQLREGAHADAAQLTQWVRERIRPEAVPSRIFLVAEIPRTERGKLNRDAVTRICQEQRGAS